MYCDYHTHTPLCLHASGTPQEYVQAAVRARLREYGISDHAPMPITADGECLGGSIVDHAVAVVGAEPKTVAAQRDDAVLYEAFVAERCV